MLMRKPREKENFNLYPCKNSPILLTSSEWGPSANYKTDKVTHYKRQYRFALRLKDSQIILFTPRMYPPNVDVQKTSGYS